jgi:lipopolysaccharide biosynthesis glycosyltransferase
MLIPALFVADGVRRAVSPLGAPFDVLIFVPTDDVTDAHRAWAAERCIALRHDVDVSFVRDIPILQSRLSPATLVKLLLAEHLSGRYDKILYLDADLVIAGDVSALFRLDMGAHAVAAVPAGRLWVGVPEAEKSWRLAHMQALGMTPPYRYFNSGVLLIAVDSWKRQQLTRRTLEFIRKHPDICLLPDEDALNGVLDGDILELSPIWNARPRSRLAFSMDETRPVIVHYDGPLKPWIRFKKGKGLLQDLDAYRLSEAERRLQQATVREYYTQSRFADVEQGITIRDGSRLRLAPALPHATRATLVADPPGLAPES